MSDDLRLRGCAWIWILVLAPAAEGQWFSPAGRDRTVAGLLAPVYGAETGRPGLHVERAVAYTGYVSTSLDGVSGVPSTLSRLGSELETRGEVTISWRARGPWGHVSLLYIPSLAAYQRRREWNSVNQTLRLEGEKISNQRLRFGFSANAGSDGWERIALITPEAGAAAGALLQPRVAPQLSRSLTAGGSVSLSYDHTPRLTSRVGFSGSHTQLLSGFELERSDPLRSRFLVSRTNAGQADLGLSYRWSRYTTVGAELSGARYVSELQDLYLSRAVGRITRLAGPHWTLNGYAGGSLPTRARGSAPVARRGVPFGWVAGGRAEYKERGNSFSLYGERTAGDQFGLGAQSSYSASVAWTARPRGSQWALYGAAGHHRMEIQGFSAFRVWQGRAGFARFLNRELAVVLDYSYVKSSSPFTGVFDLLSQRGPRLALVWSPEPTVPRQSMPAHDPSF